MRVGEREPALGEEPARVLGGCSSGLAEGVVRKHLPGSRDVHQHTVEDRAVARIAVHAELEEVPQETAALGDADGERDVDPRTLGSAGNRVGVSGCVAGLAPQEGHQIPHGGEPEAQHRRILGEVA